MNLIDIIVLIVLGFFALKGMIRGLINEVSSLGGLLLGVFFAYSYYSTIAVPLQKLLHLPKYIALFLSFLLILIAVGIIAHIIGNIITTALKLVMLGSINRIGGIGIGFIEGGLLLSLCFNALTVDFMPEGVRHSIRSSLSGPLFAATGAEIMSLWHRSNSQSP
jgi:membrane protein required for colicin V production